MIWFTSERVSEIRCAITQVSQFLNRELELFPLLNALPRCLIPRIVDALVQHDQDGHHDQSNADEHQLQAIYPTSGRKYIHDHEGREEHVT